MSGIYCKIKEERKEYLGERYFAMASDNELVLQVCISGNKELRRGRSNNIGVYFISRLTFVQNYFATNYIDVIEKQEFDEQLLKMLDAFKQVAFLTP